MQFRALQFVFLVWTAIAAAPLVCAADDDVIGKVPNPEQGVEQFINVRNMDAQIDQWLFPGCVNAEMGRQKIETQIKLQLAEIDRACSLSAAQKERLALAARGDLQRFLEQVATLRRKLDALKNDQQNMGQIWQEVQPFQARQARGLTGPDSLLAKTTLTTLTPEQAEQYDAAQRDRRGFHYHSMIFAALHELEGTVAFTGQQRESLTKILMTFPPPRLLGQYDRFLVKYRLAILPPEKLLAILDDRQMQVLRPTLNQARATGQNMIEQGGLTKEDFAAQPREGQP